MQLRAPRKGALFSRRETIRCSDDQEGNDDQAGGDSHRGDQHLSAVPFGPIDPGSTAGGNNSRVIFCRIRVLARQSRASSLGTDLKRERISMNRRTPHGRMVTPTE